MFLYTFCRATIPLVVPYSVENVRRAQKFGTKKSLRDLPLLRPGVLSVDTLGMVLYVVL